ncbi:hypothetical protein SAMD00019534_024090 [Acytostelium subglobosum LB1]|uniref:hypothetical protein n=1 Tax=Acytostelium subglobosum LB1 TaxID=1410327 RepID=UPI000644E17D|nr:hypothetical protein SAMD00019534_024090 [Acytostelium subglobosum LB1]GAM19234.1 hypothetical protein SAMD00019534_024090 [Acytostelium subglobosum LB1]|eukprot:XP_012757161.1 hypothetical protein SAMD00019534_024090 [Acytostelium subglobosum LB1]
MHLRMFEVCKDWCNNNGYDVIGGYLSPVGDAYKKPTLIPSRYRVDMVNAALESSDWLSIDTWECKRPEFTPTRQVMDHLCDVVNEHLQTANNSGQPPVQIKLIGGADMLGTFNVPKLWAETDMDIITSSKYGLLCLERIGSNIRDIIAENPILTKNADNIKAIDVGVLNDISSTKLRELIRNDRSIKYLTPDSVIDYIKRNDLYRTLPPTPTPIHTAAAIDISSSSSSNN